MDAQIEHLEDLARAFAGLNDAERLDHAAQMARSLRSVVDSIRTGELDAPPALVARLSGVVIAYEAITAGREPGVAVRTGW